MYVCMYGLYSYICVCIHLCVDACMFICMHVCIHVCMYIILKLGFEQYGRGNCPSWEGKLSGGIVRGEFSGGIVQGENVRSPTCGVLFSEERGLKGLDTSAFF